MNPYLLEFTLPTAFKQIFGSLPLLVYVVLLAGGLILMFMPDPSKKKAAATEAVAGAKSGGRGMLLGLFLGGLLLFIGGLIGVGVSALNDNADEGASYAALQAIMERNDADAVVENPLAAMSLSGSLGTFLNGQAAEASEALGADLPDLTQRANTVAYERAQALQRSVTKLPSFQRRGLRLNGADPAEGIDAEAAEEAFRAAFATAATKMSEDEFPLDPVQVPAYGVMIMLGFLAAIGIAYVRSQAYGLDPNIIIDLGIISMVAGILGARLFHVIEYWNEFYIRYQPEPNLRPDYWIERDFMGAISEAVQIQKGGLVFLGGLIMAVLSILVYLRLRKLPILFYLDFGAMSVPLGLAFGRIGCFLNGCCWGAACDPTHPLAISYESMKELGDLTYMPGTALYASQMVASLAAFLLFALLAVYYQFVARKRGETLAMLFLLYGINRFLNQMLRADVPEYNLFGQEFASSQILSMVLMLLGAAGWVYLRYFRGSELPPRRIGIELERRGIKKLNADGSVPPVPAKAPSAS